MTRPKMSAVPTMLALALASVLLLAACVPGIGGDDDASVDAEPAPADGTDDGADGSEDDGSTDGSAGSDNGGAGAGVVVDATFEEGPCGFTAPTGTSPRCGTVAVPMDWATGEGSIQLAVAVYTSVVDNPAPDPVVYLEGGPGGHALESSRFVGDDLILPLLERGDVIVFDQRGAGLSEPEMNCTEITELTREIEDNPGQEMDVVNDRFFDALSACSARLTSEGVNLEAFHTVNNAHDVEAIRVALGYDEWNLLGISYGTKLALEVLRQHPDGVRTAVIDSVFPQQIDSVLENPQTFLDSLDTVSAACAAEPECAAQGDLRQRLIDVVQRYDADPIEVEVTDFLTGATDDVSVEGETLIGVMSQALYSPFTFTDLPELITELENGEVAAVESYLSLQRTNEPFFTDGMFYAIECNEEIVFADEAEVAAAIPADPFGLQESYDYASNNGLTAFGTCDAFGRGEAPEGSNDPVLSDIPTLVMAGRFDPVTPISWAEAAAEGLDNHFLVIAPHDSHGVSTGECGMSVVRQFLDAPDVEPDASCYDDETISFLGAPDEVEMEPFRYDGGLGVIVSGVRPSGWEQGDLQGDFYRQESLLDSTLLFQLAGTENLGLLIDNYLSTVVGIDLDAGVRVPGPAGRSWNTRRGTADGTAAEVWETDIDGTPVFVLLVTDETELEGQIDTVLLPALAAIEVEPA